VGNRCTPKTDPVSLAAEDGGMAFLSGGLPHRRRGRGSVTGIAIGELLGMLTRVGRRKIGIVRRRQGSTTWSNPARSKPNKTNSPLYQMWCLVQGAAFSE
jgi:hypothetical protein